MTCYHSISDGHTPECGHVCSGKDCHSPSHAVGCATVPNGRKYELRQCAIDCGEVIHRQAELDALRGRIEQVMTCLRGLVQPR